MAATYVKITRAEFEDWLYELCPVFQRDEKTQGLYLCPLSPYVAVKLSTTLGRDDAVIAKSHGRCRMSFVRRENSKEIRASHRSSHVGFQRCNRTQGWRGNWADGLKDMFAAFKKDREHYNQRGKQTQEEYAAEWAARIESVAGWQDKDILRDLRDQLQLGHWLTPNQERAVWKFVRPPRGTSGRKGHGKRPKSTSRGAPGAKVDGDFISGLDALTVAARKAGDEWTAKFAEGNVRARAEGGHPPSARQAEVLREKFTKYGIKPPAAVAA